MNTTKITRQKPTLFYAIGFLILLLCLAGCSLKWEDVGPYQGDQQTYAFTDFDRIDMGSAFVITVQQGTTFNVDVEGDRRNLADLQVYTRSGTLIAQYRIARRREYQTSFTITMPTLRSVDFSGASRSIMFYGFAAAILSAVAFAAALLCFLKKPRSRKLLWAAFKS